MTCSSTSWSLPCIYFHHHHHHSNPIPPSTTCLPSLHGGAGLRSSRARLLPRAKFDKFDGLNVTSGEVTDSIPPQQEQEDLEQVSDLPPDLEGAIRRASEASAAFVSSGGMRAIVKLLIPQLQFLDAEGELWELSRIFLESLREETGFQRVKAIFPDAGVAALLKYQWKEANFGFSSLSDRKLVEDEDEVVVMIVHDYQMLEYVEKIASRLLDDPPRPLIMWNPRLVSEEVGVGFNVRKLRRYFLRMWKVFYDFKNRPNRYLLAKEQPSHPDATDIEIIFGNVTVESGNEPSLMVRAKSMFSSLNRFMRAIR